MSTTLVRVRVDAAWVNGPVVTGAEMSALDANTVLLANGDEGGSWTLGAGNVGIAGAGVWLTATGNLLSGANATTGGDLIHGDDDYLKLDSHSGSTRTLIESVSRGIFSNGWDVDNGTASLLATSLGAALALPLRVHNGATFSQAVFSFKIATHVGVPAVLPQFRVVKVDANGVKTPLLTNGNGGFLPYTPQPANHTAWEAAVSFTYALDAGVIVDVSQYEYFAEIVDESGTNAVVGNVYTDVVATMTTILNLAPQ